jgi:hypothetical protein
MNTMRLSGDASGDRVERVESGEMRVAMMVVMVMKRWFVVAMKRDDR